MRLVLALLFIAACTEEPPPAGPQVTSHVVTFDIPFIGRGKLDVLFVIDASTAMAPYRDQVLAQLSGFAQVLADYPDGMPDLNIAVTTADFAGGGALHSTAAVDGPFLIDGMRDGVRVRNYTGDLGSALVQLADVGATATSAPRPFDVLPLALDAPGFLRANAPLGVVMINGTDDASTTTAQDIAVQLKIAKTDPANVMVFGIHPQPAPRLDDFFSRFPNRAGVTPIDAVDLSEGFRMIQQLYRTVGLAACLYTPPIDVDPETPGQQYECAVEVFDNAAKTSALWKRCDQNVKPCWDVRPDPGWCSGEYLRLVIDFGPEKLPYDGGEIRGQCLAE